MKKLFLLLAAAVMAAGCNQNPPSVGGTGTITPVDDPTEPIEPSDAMHISYIRYDSLAYGFNCKFNRSTEGHTARVLWEITDPGKTEHSQSRMPYSETFNYTFQAPGKARITATYVDYQDISTSTSASITVDVY